MVVLIWWLAWYAILWWGMVYKARALSKLSKGALTDVKPNWVDP